jgi:hypothetical protein
MRIPRARLLWLGAFTLCSTAALGIAQRPIPPGVRQADRSTNSGANVEAPQGQGAKSIDPAKLRADAAELQSLTATVLAQVDQVSKGTMPKDVSDNLKKLEKLAKHLRSEINP